MSRAIVQVWTAPQCETGAVCLGPLNGWQSARVTESSGVPEQVVFTGVPTPVMTAASMSEGRCLKIISETRGVSWWVVTQIADRAGVGSGLATVTAGPLKYLLALRGLVRDGDEYSFTPPDGLTAGRALEEYVLNTPDGGSARPELAADGLDWLTLGDIYFEWPIALPAFSRQTRLQLLTQIEALTPYTVQLRPLVPDGSTGFALDLVLTTLDDSDPTHLSTGSNVATVERTRDLLRSASVVVPFGANDRQLGVVSLVIDTITGAGPAWIALQNVEGTEVIRERGQFVGAYLRQQDGTTHEITDSRVRANALGTLISEVQIASITGLSVNDTVALVRTTTSLPLTEIESPSALAARGRVVGQQASGATSLERNWLLSSADFSESLGVVENYSLVGSAEAVSYLRVEDPTAWSAQANGGHSIGATTVGLKLASADQRLFKGEKLDFGPGGIRTLAANTNRFSAGGTVSVSLTAGLAAGISDGQAVTALHVIGTSTTAAKRPVAAGVPRTGNAGLWLRFTTGASSTAMPPVVTQDQIRSDPVLIHYQTEAPERNTIHLSAGFTSTYGTAGSGSFGNLDGSLAITSDPLAVVTRRLPGIMLVGAPSTSPTRLAYAICAEPIAKNATVNETITCTHTITGDTEVAAALLPPAEVGATIQFHVCRWASLWLGDNDVPPILNGSSANVAFAAAQDALADGNGATRVRVTGVDLAALLASGERLALGQRVRLRAASLAMDGLWRVVRLDWSLDDDATLSAELGTVRPRLTAVTVSL